MQRTDRRTYGPQTGDENIYQHGRNQLIVALPETDFKRQWPEVPRDYLKIAEELGSGAFGIVRKGYLMRNNKVIECAVKMLKSECFSYPRQKLMRVLFWILRAKSKYSPLKKTFLTVVSN